ncbi:uncharacterized protein FIESC28_08789 [Fusarium coffeatum]|uniref:Uncharacterized protein n=1 Tax=Fusarium coffeatum TaxID=231269 RepID=A0A366R4E6_9HYPO|nr:uncharacterized protein FIESC28_08789 [Fusarium coffeatum]RBR12019.1 hypothetical protein FIESC28_08789 [Fusarium coffeatum]
MSTCVPPQSEAQPPRVDEHPNAQDLRDAILNDNVDGLREVLERHKDLFNTIFSYDFQEDGIDISLQLSALLFAAVTGRILVVKVLLTAGAAVNTAIPEIGGNALHLVARYGYEAIARLLIARKANIDQSDRAGNTPLHLACKYHHINVIHCFLDNGAIRMRNRMGRSPFHIASTSKCACVLDLLWNRGPTSQISETDLDLNQPLHLAAISDSACAARWLCKSGAPRVGQNYRKDNPLDEACVAGNLKAAEAILQSSDDSILQEANGYGFTPLLLACFNAWPRIVELLLGRGALVSNTTPSFLSCYHLLALNKRTFSQDHRDIVDHLHGRGADIDMVSRKGDTPLILACRKGKVGMVRMLLQHGARINFKSKESSGLLEASIQQDVDVLEEILKWKPDMSHRNNHGLTAVSLACRFGRVNNLKLLIKHGADVLMPTIEGLPPLWIATNFNHVEAALEILGTQFYYPANPLDERDFPKEDHCRASIANGLLHGFDNNKISGLDDRRHVMYWAVRSGCLELTKRCIGHQQEGERETLELLQGDQWKSSTWLHVAARFGHHQLVRECFSHVPSLKKAAYGKSPLHLAAVSGTIEVAVVLLQLVSEQHGVEAKIHAIIEADDSGESPLSLSVRRETGAHQGLAKLFWSELEALTTISYKHLRSDINTASIILETLARYERPGRERILEGVLKQWCSSSSIVTGYPSTALNWAINNGQAIVVWWLLSKGGYSSKFTIHQAFNLAIELDTDPMDTARHLITDMLKTPPPILDNVPNPNDDLPPCIPDGNEDKDDVCYATVVHIHEDGAVINAHYAEGSIHDMIYNEKQGPSSIMTHYKKSLGLRGLESLKSRLSCPPLIGKDFGTAACRRSQSAPVDSFPKRSPGCDDNTLKVQWIHLPVNKLHLMRDLSTRVSHDTGRSEMDHNNMISRFNQSWTEIPAAAGHLYMKPQCERARTLPSGRVNEQIVENHVTKETPVALYMPYLTLGNKSPGHRTRETQTFESFNEPIHGRSTRSITHIPITLDQYYYPVLDDTSIRDEDQVMSRYWENNEDNGKDDSTIKREEVTYKSRDQEGQDLPGPTDDKRILMISQLWIWIVDETTIITATEETSIMKDGFLKTVLDSMRNGEAGTRFARPTSVHAMMELMLDVATSFTISDCVHTSKSTISPIDVFRESIKDVVNEETKLFNAFLKELKDDTANRSQQRGQSGRLFGIYEVPPNPNHIIHREAELLREIRDIRDELGMLKALLEHQETVWKQAFDTEELRGCFQYHHPWTPTDIKEDLDEILAEVERTIDSINTLLDLRTKQASIKDAEYGRIQANDEARQSKSVFIFTIVTVVFLPLSFLSSLFALDVSSFPHESGNLKYKPEWIFPIIFGVTAIVSIPVMIFAWNVNSISRQLRPGPEPENTPAPPQAVGDRQRTAETGMKKILRQRSSWRKKEDNPV